MTWVRARTITGETNNSPAEFDSYGVDLPLYSTDLPYSGTYSLRFSRSQDGIGITQSFSDQSVRLGYWMRHSDIDDTGYFFEARINSNGRITVGFYWVPDVGIFAVQTDGAGAVTNTFLAPAGVHQLNVIDKWLHVGVHLDIDTTGVSFTATLYINGIEVGSVINNSTASHDGLYIGKAVGTGWENFMYADDLYFEYDDTGLVAPAPPPPYRFPYSAPDGAGADADWTPVGAAANWQAVDEIGAPDGDTTHNSVTGASMVDTFTHADVIPAGHVILAAVPRLHADASAPADIRMVAFDGSVYGNGATRGLAGAGYEMLEDYFILQPDSSAWNNADFNSMQFGYESLSA